MTASAGSDEKRLEDICRNCGIQRRLYHRSSPSIGCGPSRREHRAHRRRRRVQRWNPSHTARSTRVDQRSRVRARSRHLRCSQQGIGLATGDVVGFLHSDDLYAHEHVAARIAAAFEDPDVDAVYGDLEYVQRRHPERVLRHWRSGMFSPRALSTGWMPPHPTLYVRRELYARLGCFDTAYRIASDYEFMLRLLSDPHVRVAYLPEVLYGCGWAARAIVRWATFFARVGRTTER